MDISLDGGVAKAVEVPALCESLSSNSSSTTTTTNENNQQAGTSLTFQWETFWVQTH
jgi:hypothetical protein